MIAPRVDVEADGDVVVATLAGDVDLSNTAAVAGVVLNAVPNDACGLVVDLSLTRYLDSSGIQMLFEFTRLLEAGRQSIALVIGPESPVRTLVELTGLHHAAAVRATRDEAVAAVRAGEGRRY